MARDYCVAVASVHWQGIHDTTRYEKRVPWPLLATSKRSSPATKTIDIRNPSVDKLLKLVQYLRGGDWKNFDYSLIQSATYNYTMDT